MIDLNDGTECTVSWVADGTSPGEVAHKPEGSAAIQTREDLSRLEKWADRNLVHLNKGKCKVLHLGRTSSYCELTGWKAALQKRPGDAGEHPSWTRASKARPQQQR